MVVSLCLEVVGWLGGLDGCLDVLLFFWVCKPPRFRGFEVGGIMLCLCSGLCVVGIVVGVVLRCDYPRGHVFFGAHGATHCACRFIDLLDVRV